MSNFELRKYQKKGLNSFKEWYSSVNVDTCKDINDRLSTIILPTGTGKTKLASSCIEDKFKSGEKPKVLWCAHREELIEQAYGELSAIDCAVEKEMAKDRASSDADIVVGSVATLHRDRKNMKDFEPTLIVVDEWHHYHQKNTQYHGLLEKFPKAKILGLTATPFRFVGGDLPLGKKLIEMDIGTAIAHKYLVPPTPEVLKSKVSLANVKTRMGDFATEELANTVNNHERNWLIAKRILSAILDEKRQGILFSVNVAHSKAMAEMLRKGGVRVAEVYGDTPKDERREIMQKIRNREIDVFCNNLVGCEGFDVPHFNFVCIARPTRSLGLYIQMVGRGLRLFDDKDDCLIIDVFDKLKVTQSVANYKKVADFGDIDGSRRRTEAVMKEEVADKLSNFPVVMKLGKSDVWELDNETWFSPAWKIDINQWVVTWSKRAERKSTGDFTWQPLKFNLTKSTLKKEPIKVNHKKYGIGFAKDVSYSSKSNMFSSGQIISVDFETAGIVNVPREELEIKKEKLESVKLDKPIKRAFYIITNDTKDYCRIIALLQEGNHFTVETDIKGDQGTVDEMIRSFANEDDMVAIVKSSAAWRKRDASSKQKDLIKKMMMWGKLNSDLDIDSLSGGDASALMDQVDWKPIINNLFGAKKREDLIGYLTDFDDV